MIDIQDTRSIIIVLGCLINKPSLLIESGIQLSTKDFPKRFHKIIFSTIKSLYNSEIQHIDNVAIDSYIAQYPEQYKIFEDENGLEWVEKAVELTNIDMFDYHAERVKKFTLLRNLKDNGFDIGKIYNEEDEEKLKLFDKMSINDIINFYNKLILDIESDIIQLNSSSHIGQGLKELKEELSTTPTMGLNTGINALNYYTYGLRKKYYLFSAKTGEGKTRIQAYLALQIGYYQKIPCLFITTEVEKDEVQTMMLSHIAKIPERKILLNDLTPKERERLDKAIEELEQSCIEVLFMPDFNLEAVEHTIKRYILSKKIEYVFFDYIKESMSMIEGINKKVGKVDGWKALNLFSERLKELSQKYGVGIISATQLARDGYTSGSSAIPNAVDVWAKLRIVSTEEQQKLNLETFDSNTEIMAIDIEKNRRGMKDFSIYLEANLGQLSFEEIQVMKGGNIISVPNVSF